MIIDIDLEYDTPVTDHCGSCTACIDACDHMMESVNLPKGLIRYASEDNIAKKIPFRLTARMKGYSAVLGILVFALTAHSQVLVWTFHTNLSLNTMFPIVTF